MRTVTICAASVLARAVCLLLAMAPALFLSQMDPPPPHHDSHPISWHPYPAFNNATQANKSKTAPSLESHQYLASTILQQPVYMTLTTIRSRLFGIPATINSIISGTVLPDEIFILLSKEAYLLDEGMDDFDLDAELEPLAQLRSRFPMITVVFTKNIGPHRKLLPLLSRKWNEDCVIITIDDHEIYKPTAVSGLVRYYLYSSRSAVVALRSRRMGVCSNVNPNRSHKEWRLCPYSRNGKGLWPESMAGQRELLSLPTGTSGVLYRPRFFHPSVIFSAHLVNLTRTGDDLMFRLATLARGVPVVTACTSETVHTFDFCPVRPPRAVWGSTGPRNLSVAVQQKWDKTVFAPLPVDMQSALVDTTSSSHLRRRRSLHTASREWTADPRKKVSLASKFNVFGGNNMMWQNAVAYLQSISVLDVPQLVADGALLWRERGSRCFYKTGSAEDTSAAVMAKHWWALSDCGIVKCAPNEQ